MPTVNIEVASFKAPTRNATMLSLSGKQGMGQPILIRDDTKKPFLQTPDRARHGVSIAHVRKLAAPFSLMATSRSTNIGLDAEPWGSTTDARFLNFIASAEDEKLANLIQVRGRDAATFIWVGKEAALKAFGQVMHDPRDIAISHQSGNKFRAEAAKRASNPMVSADLLYFTMPIPGKDGELLLAVAVSDLPTRARAIVVNADSLEGLSQLNLE